MKYAYSTPTAAKPKKSGNGLRIFSKYLADAGYTGARREFKVLTKGGLARIALLHPKAELMEVDMGKASFFSRNIPVNGEPRDVVAEEINVGGTPFRMTCVSVGNPHCIIVVDQATKAWRRRWDLWWKAMRCFQTASTCNWSRF